MWLPGRKMAGGEVVDMFNNLAVEDSVRPDDGCSCEVEVIEEERPVVASKEVEETGRGPAATVATAEYQAAPSSAHFICTNEGDTDSCFYNQFDLPGQSEDAYEKVV